MGHAPSSAWMSTFTGELLMSAVQHIVATAGLVPVMENVLPGNSVAAWDTTCSVVAGSISVKVTSTHTLAPSQISMLFDPVTR